MGGGKTLFDARRIFYKTICDKTIAIINACEHESSIASKECGGSNPLDLINLHEDITTAKEKADYILVITHGGIEGYQLPTPRMKRTYRHLIDLGADAVVNHHQHCFSGYEIYKEKPIFYGLGNFCFDWGTKFEGKWNEGYAVQLFFNKSITFNIIPYKQCEDGPMVKLLPSEFYDRAIQKLNEIIQNDQLLEENYHQFIESRKNMILLGILPVHNKYLKALFKRGIISLPYKEKDLIIIKNKLCCESHLDNLITSLSDSK